MRLSLLAILVSLALTQASSSPAAAENRVALVIGNGAYQHVPPLRNPSSDASAVAAALQRSGFETITSFNLSQREMENAAIDFARAARNADVALFYYSGHALQYNGVNYLVPVDTDLRDETDLRRMTRVDQIVADLQYAKNLRILILDACRDNPFAEVLRRSLGTTRGIAVANGLAKIDTPQGMIVAYATQSGQTASDGKGRNSPFTAAFLRHIEKQEEIGVIFRDIGEDVYEETRHTQLPELSLSLIGRFYLRGSRTDAVRTAATSAPPPAQPEAPRPADIQASLDPAASPQNAAPAAPSPIFLERRASAERGDAAAQFELGNMFLNGEGTAIDYVMAMAWLRKAADQGHSAAQANVAYLFDTGRGVPRSAKQAFSWYIKSAEQGQPFAQYKVAEAYRNAHGVDQDFAQALAWYIKAAPEMDSLKVRVGQMYEAGQGTTQDYAQALAWYTKAADKGEPRAFYHIGQMHENGLGVPRNLPEAVQWYRKGVEKWDTDAQNALRRIEAQLVKDALDKMKP